jgi:hypothetical protein
MASWITPQALELITAVGPPDCATITFGFEFIVTTPYQDLLLTIYYFNNQLSIAVKYVLFLTMGKYDRANKFNHHFERPRHNRQIPSR